MLLLLGGYGVGSGTPPPAVIPNTSGFGVRRTSDFDDEVDRAWDDEAILMLLVTIALFLIN